MSDPGGNPFEDFDLEAETDEAADLANADLELTAEMIAAFAAQTPAVIIGGKLVQEQTPAETAQVSTRETLLRLLRVPMGQPVRVMLKVTLQGRDGERFVQAIHALMSRMRRHARKQNITLEPFKLYVEYIAKTEDGLHEEVSLLRWDKARPAASAFDALLVQAKDRPGMTLDMEISGDAPVVLQFDNSETSKKE